MSERSSVCAARRRRAYVVDASPGAGNGCRARRRERSPSIRPEPAPEQRAGEQLAAEAAELAAIPEWAGHADLDPILAEWVPLAATAWYGHQLAGRGVVLVTVTDDGATIEYEPGPLCDCHAHMVATYDPETQIVVAVRQDDGEAIYLLGGWPPPPEAFAVTQPDAIGVVLQ